jgi:hypothetical protein
VFQPETEQDLISVDLSIPPVAELVLRFAKKKRCSLREATLAIRDSEHARAFRNWCSIFASHTEDGRPGAKKQIEMIAQLDDVCRMWRENVNEGVQYKTRKLNLEHLPKIGGVLKALNMQEAFTIKDPILLPKKEHSYSGVCASRKSGSGRECEPEEEKMIYGKSTSSGKAHPIS